jgi:hypothetical protein
MAGSSNGTSRGASAPLGCVGRQAENCDRERILIATSRLRLILSQLIDQLRMPLAPGPTYPYPRLRNFVIDVLAEGRRKQIAHVLLEADIGGVNEKLAELRLRGGEQVSMTSYIAKGFALAVEENKRMQAYRLGRSRIVVFDDVDLAFMIEREWEGEAPPVFYLLRKAQRKTVYEIHRELRAAREAPPGAQGPMSALEMQFFPLPAFLRKALWFFVRRNPYWFKDLAGSNLDGNVYVPSRRYRADNANDLDAIDRNDR